MERSISSLLLSFFSSLLVCQLFYFHALYSPLFYFSLLSSSPNFLPILSSCLLFISILYSPAYHDLHFYPLLSSHLLSIPLVSTCRYEKRLFFIFRLLYQNRRFALFFSIKYNYNFLILLHRKVTLTLKKSTIHPKRFLFLLKVFHQIVGE